MSLDEEGVGCRMPSLSGGTRETGRGNGTVSPHINLLAPIIHTNTTRMKQIRLSEPNISNHICTTSTFSVHQSDSSHRLDRDVKIYKRAAIAVELQLRACNPEINVSTRPSATCPFNYEADAAARTKRSSGTRGDDAFTAFSVIELTANLDSLGLSISSSAYLSSAVTRHYVAAVEKLIAAAAGAAPTQDTH